MKRTLSIALLALGILGGFFFPLIQPATVREVTHEVVREVPALGSALPISVAVFETSLASPLSSSATSLTLTANAIRGGGVASGYTCVTIDEGSAQREDMCGTLSGTSMTGIQRGIDPANGTSTVATLQFAHRRGANVKITDFPLITIMRNQLNGVERLENLMVYSTSSQPCAVGSATGTICAKAYIDSVAVAGASNGDETTKGIFEAATALEQASSTALGSTLAGLVLQSRYATDTPTYGCAAGFTGTAGAGCTVVANLLGKIAQSFWNLTEAFTWTGAHTFTATTTFSGKVVNAVPQTELFGSGADGASTTGASYSLSRDYNFTDFTVSSGNVITTNGYRIFVSGTFLNNGTIRNNGSNGGAGSAGGAGGSGGQAGTAGTASPAGTLGAGSAGVAGGAGQQAVGSNGTAGGATNPSMGVIGAAGGNGGAGASNGGGTGGAAGTITAEAATASFGVVSSSTLYASGTSTLTFGFSAVGATSKTSLSPSAKGGGGGGGGGNGAEQGGGGGGSGSTGGIIEIFAYYFSNLGTIEASGGNGGAGGACQNSAGGGGGGGAGGSGGVIVLGYHSLLNYGIVTTSGGTAGAGYTTGCFASGLNGTAGVTGNIFKIIP